MNRPSKLKQKIHPSNTYVEINQPRSQSNKPLAFFDFVLVHKRKKQNETKQNEINKQTNLAILVNNECADAIKHFFEFFELCYRGLTDRGQATDT